MEIEEIIKRLKILLPMQNEYYQVAINEAIKILEERPQGKWRNYEGMTTCEKCGAECLYDEEGFYSLSRFCPNCGADMRGKEE